MDLKDYLATLSADAEEVFAHDSGGTVGHLRNVASGFRTASPRLASAMERASHGAVTRRDLRPDDWHLIWPELASLPTKEEA